MDDFELAAGEIVAAAVGGTAHQRDPGGGSTQVHDFDILLPSGGTIAVEVTRYVVPAVEQVDAEIKKRDWQVGGLKTKWFMRRSGFTKVRDLYGARKRVLLELDRSPIGEGEIRLNDPDNSNLQYSDETQAALRRLQQLGVVGVGRLGPADGHDDVVILYQSSVGSTGSSAAVSRLESVLAREDNVAKLAAATEAQERHLFLWFGSSAGVVSCYVADDLVPDDPVRLPSCVDRVWICAASEGARPKSYHRLTGWDVHGERAFTRS